MPLTQSISYWRISSVCMRTRYGGDKWPTNALRILPRSHYTVMWPSRRSSLALARLYSRPYLSMYRDRMSSVLFAASLYSAIHGARSWSPFCGRICFRVWPRRRHRLLWGLIWPTQTVRSTSADAHLYSPRASSTAFIPFLDLISSPLCGSWAIR